MRSLSKREARAQFVKLLRKAGAPTKRELAAMRKAERSELCRYPVK